MDPKSLKEVNLCDLLITLVPKYSSREVPCFLDLEDGEGPAFLDGFALNGLFPTDFDFEDEVGVVFNFLGGASSSSESEVGKIVRESPRPH